MINDSFNIIYFVILKFRQFFPGIAWFITSFYLFTLPGKKIPSINWFDVIHGDKMVHIGIFALLVGLFLLPWKKASPKKLKTIATAFALAGIIYGIAIEYIQGNFIENRSFDTGDIWADAAGSLLPLLFLSFKKNKQERNDED